MMMACHGGFPDKKQSNNRIINFGFQQEILSTFFLMQMRLLLMK